MEDDRHYKEVQQEALGGVRTVEVEKKQSEEQSEELEAGVTEGCPQEFQSGNCRQEDVTAGDDRLNIRINTLTLQTPASVCSFVFLRPCASNSLDSQLLAVAEGKAVISERAQNNGGVHHVLLKAEQSHVQAFKPHQHGVLWNTDVGKGLVKDFQENVCLIDSQLSKGIQYTA